MKKCKYEKALRQLVKDNQAFMRWLDAEMVKPSTHERGRRIATALNGLGMAVDRVRFFTLDVDYRNDKNPTFGKPKRSAPTPPAQEDGPAMTEQAPVGDTK